MTELAQNLLNGLSLGALYALLALGLAIVFSVMNLVNFAHGELITITGFAMLGFQALGWSTGSTLLVGVAVAGLAAMAMERLAFRPVRNAPGTTLLLTSFGLSIVIQNVLLAATEPKPLAVQTPSWLRSQVQFGPLQIQNLQLMTMLLTALALVGLTVVLRRTQLGIAMRAAAEDFDVVRLMGISADRVIRGAFLISGLLAGLAAVLIVARRGAVSPFMGLIFVLKAFVAAVLGGFGSMTGAVAGGFALGAMEVVFEVLLPGQLAGFRDAFVFLLVGVVLVTRPQGIFGQLDRAFA